MKEMSRLSKEEKQELLTMFSGDSDTYQLAKTMCLKYLEVYPSEKSFKTKVYSLIKKYKYDYSGGWSNFELGNMDVRIKSYPPFEE